MQFLVIHKWGLKKRTKNALIFKESKSPRLIPGDLFSKMYGPPLREFGKLAIVGDRMEVLIRGDFYYLVEAVEDDYSIQPDPH